VWKDSETPSISNAKTPMTFQFDTGNFEIPVLVDLRTGTVFEIPPSNWIRTGSNFLFKDIPVYDSPILIVDKSLITLIEKDKRI
jgi:hypothetical protein